MADAQSFEKAEIWRLDRSGQTPIEIVPVHFNPTEYNFSRSINWPRHGIRSDDTGKADFGGGEPTSLSMQLFFDTYEERRDVRTDTEKIWQMSMVDKDTTKHPTTGQSRPPFVKFRWGRMWGFKAVISSISQRFTLFLPNGMPVRAIMDITFMQMDEAPLKQNPTSGGGPPVKRHIVRPGDTIAGIAYAEYHDPTLWRVIAEANELENPMQLVTGQELEIPATP